MSHISLHGALIGITVDEQSVQDTISYVLRPTYTRAISSLGGVPVLLPYDNGNIETYLDLVDGLLFTGGGFAIDPELFGQKNISRLPTRSSRAMFELELCQAGIARKMPILGICAGAQLINVAMGGTLIQSLPDQRPGGLNHSLPLSHTHPITIQDSTMLARIHGLRQETVNTSHVQAIDAVGERVIVNAYAPDGIVEGIEVADHPFCLGVQWHPEAHMGSALSEAIFSAFIRASLSHRGKAVFPASQLPESSEQRVM